MSRRYAAGQLFAAYAATIAGALTAATIFLRAGARATERLAGGRL